MDKLYKNSKDGIFLGVVQGLSEWADFDPAILRIVLVILSIIGCGSLVIVYLIMALALKEKPEPEKERKPFT